MVNNVIFTPKEMKVHAAPIPDVMVALKMKLMIVVNIMDPVVRVRVTVIMMVNVRQGLFVVTAIVGEGFMMVLTAV